MSSPTTAVVRPTASCTMTRVPPEIELCIVQALIETHKRSKKPGFRLSTFASVSKTWQALIEKETYHHIKIAPHELDSFKHHVRSYRKLLVKHILLEIPYDFFLDPDKDPVLFSKAVHALWRILSRWKTHRVTVELGIVSRQARRFIEARHNPSNPSNTFDQHFWSSFDLWNSLTFQQSGLLVPDSTKRLTYFEEFHTTYHQHAGAMVMPRPNATLLKSISQAANRLEHISVSFAFDAQTFFDRLIRTEFKALKTLALTSSFSGTSESLLINAAEAVKEMPALKLLEIWNFEAGHVQADVFRYERLDRYQGRITWQSTKQRKISSNVERSWKDLLRRGENGFDIKRSSFPMDIRSLQDLLPNLKLREQILRNLT
ncbi:uncharacterized protein FSUBG_10672 [Fusarium subglutinans]|uniref:DUF6546 domain-containing protein n=1 Tax=Gibberella subglutinans TaxID=42677 RepID=A0A8H5LG65_GIBSU|nr:uncharacterized protein FSUBG_10672 [Fusarium subglutinans]KAF5590808.1 hypothetical protein FSUBG_10672 [Fusarium subglutinans]